MNKFINVRNIVIAMITLAIGTFVALGASKMFFDKQETVTGNVASFVLNPEGKVDGAILDTGDQIKFGAETGEVVTANLQIGSVLTAIGHAGTKSDYGREFRAQTLQIGEQTITIAGKPKHPRDGKPGRGDRKGERDERDARGEQNKRGERPLPPADENAPETNNRQAENAKVSGNVKFVIVNREGKARAVILSGGEQLNLGREVENANLTLDSNTIVTAEGEVAKSPFGTFIRPQVLTVGNQTFAFNR